MILALLAALAMVFQDIIGVFQIQAEARNQASLAGIMDTIGWLLVITTMTISVSALQGKSLGEKVLVVVLVSLANFIGSYTGVKIGKRYIKNHE